MAASDARREQLSEGKELTPYLKQYICQLRQKVLNRNLRVNHPRPEATAAAIRRAYFYQILCANRILAGVRVDDPPAAGSGDGIWLVTAGRFTATGLESFRFYGYDF